MQRSYSFVKAFWFCEVWLEYSYGAVLVALDMTGDSQIWIFSWIQY